MQKGSALCLRKRTRMVLLHHARRNDITGGAKMSNQIVVMDGDRCKCGRPYRVEPQIIDGEVVMSLVTCDNWKCDRYGFTCSNRTYLSKVDSGTWASMGEYGLTLRLKIVDAICNPDSPETLQWGINELLLLDTGKPDLIAALIETEKPEIVGYALSIIQARRGIEEEPAIQQAMYRVAGNQLIIALLRSALADVV